MNISTDFYYPSNSNIESFIGITILILQGVDIDKKEYKNLAKLLIEKGHRVVIPNFYQKGGYLCPDHNSLNTFFQDINHFNPDFFKRNNITNSLIIFGHSAGGVAILQSLPHLIQLPLGIILYSCYPLKPTINSCLIPPILMIAGNKDTIATSEVIKSNFCDNLLGNIKIFLDLRNCDHFTVNNSSNPWQKEKSNPLLMSSFHLSIQQKNQVHITQIIDEFIKGCLSKSFDWFDKFNLSFIQEIIFNSQLSINYQDSLTKVGHHYFFSKKLKETWQYCLSAIRSSQSLGYRAKNVR